MKTSARVRLHLLGATVLLATAGPRLLAAEAVPRMQVHRSPTCGCCEAWIEHVRKAGFDVAVHSLEDLDPLKDRLGVPRRLRSCHIAEVDGYFLEGHVPATDIRRLLAERPRAKGLAVPGMPIGSPGMEVAGMTPRPFDVLRVPVTGEPSVYARHPGA
jgi:hypothetical protein